MKLDRSVRKVRQLWNPLFLRATLYWLIRRLAFIQFHDVYVIEPKPEFVPPDSERPRALTVLKHIDDLTELPEGLEDELNEQSGRSCRHVIRQGGWVYVLTDRDNLVCQSNVRFGEITVDSPTDLVMRFSGDSAFINYLYTRKAYRGGGSATDLLSLIVEDMCRFGKKRCVAHIRATNYKSIAAFRRAGWKLGGRIISTTSGSLIATPGCRKIGMLVRKTTAV